MSRRGNGEGTSVRRKDGYWVAVISLDGGKRQSSYGKTREEVARKLTQAARDKDVGLPIVPEQ